MDIIQKVLRGVDEFPTLPTIYTALSDVMSNPQSTPSHAADIIARDQSSATKILKAANSSIYGFRGRIDSITQAIFFIGFDEVKNLIISLAVMDIFKKANFSHHFSPVELWKHSIAVGVITRLLGSSLKADNLENYFLAGIIHDIGKLVFFRNLGQQYSNTIDHALDHKITIRDAEAETLGITHTVAGELVAEKWKLPSSIRNAIRNHYTGTVDGKIDELTSCVHLANICAKILGLGESGDKIIQEPNLAVWKILNFPDDIFTQIYPRIIKDYESTLALFMLK